MRTFIAALAIAFALPTMATAQDRPPNIVLIMADDLGYAEVGCFGQELIKTPHIDALAKGGMKFTNFYSGCAVCAPARCVLMTGKHMGHASSRNNREIKPEGQHPIPADDVTIAELLKEQGYATGAMGKWGLGMFGSTGDPLKQGFDRFFGYNCQRHAHSHYPTYIWDNDKRVELKGNDGKTGTEYTHDMFEREALAFIDANKAKPFFLYVPFAVPHVAVQVPEDSLAEYKGKLGPDPAYDGKKGYLPHPAPHAGYAAMVTRMDRSVGRIMAKLKELKLDENTLVIFTSDNGPTHNVGGADSTFFKSAGHLRGMKGSLYEGGIRVPTIAYWPGKIQAGSVANERFYFPDILPTFCDVAGVKIPKDIDGISFWATLSGYGQQKPHEFLYWEFSGYGGQQAVIAGDWKAIRVELRKGVVKTELYNLAKDESETTDVAEKHPDVLAKLETIMKEQHVPNPEFPLQAIDQPVKKKNKNKK